MLKWHLFMPMIRQIKYKSKLHILNVIPSVNPCRIQILKNSTPLKKFDKIDEHHSLQEFGALEKGL